MRLKPRNCDGFTLVELLVSLALLSLMTIYALNAMSSLKDINRLAEKISSQMEVEAVARHFREAISGIRPIFIMNENNTSKSLFRGMVDTLEFVTVSNGDHETGGLYVVRYGIDPEGTLTVERQMVRNGRRGAIDKVVLLRGVKSIGFEYGGPESDGKESDMSEAWSLTDRLPSVIDMTVNFDDTDSRKWSHLIVNLHST
jgi:general secretion pathway protein J